MTSPENYFRYRNGTPRPVKEPALRAVVEALTPHQADVVKLRAPQSIDRTEEPANSQMPDVEPELGVVVAAGPTVREWLVTHPAAWHGWPTRQLFIDVCDLSRLFRMVDAMTSAEVVRWFGKQAAIDPRRLYSEIASEIADVRLARRVAYNKQVEKSAV